MLGAVLHPATIPHARGASRRPQPPSPKRARGDPRAALTPDSSSRGERVFYSASWRDEMIVLSPFFTILIFVSSQTGFSVHSRYIIPAPAVPVCVDEQGHASVRGSRESPATLRKEDGSNGMASQ